MKKIKFVLLLKHQKVFVLIACLIIVFGFLLSFKFVNCSLQTTPSLSKYENCNTPFCQTVKEALVVFKSQDPKFLKAIKLSLSIFISNIEATGYEIFSTKYLFFVPVISLFQHSLQIGRVARCLSSKFFLMLFPVGLLEFLVMILFFSFYYANILKLITIIFKKGRYTRQDLNSIFWQVIIFLATYLLAAIFESISLVIKI